jgi:predicted small lipoprotein YifL
MNHIIKPMTAAVLIGALAACASKPPAGTPAYDAYMAEQAREAAIEQVDNTLKASPDWYRTPTVRPGYLVAAGTDRSADMQFALDKAVLSAKSGLAAQVNSAVSSTIKSFVAESGDPTDPVIEREIEKVAKDVVAEVSLVGHRIVKHEISREGTDYRAYVLIEMPAGQPKQSLVKQGNDSRVLKSRLRASKAFQELEAEIGKTR